MGNSYYRWSTADDISLFVQLVSPAGLGVPGKIPEVAIRRARATHGGPLDLFFWNGTTWQNTPAWLPMAEVDAVSCPGLYTYLFGQSAVASEWVYLVYFRHTIDPKGFAVEEHIITNELYIPTPLPVVPVFPGDTVMGKLVAMEDPTTPVPLANADAVWDEMLAQHLLPGSTGAALNGLGAVTTGYKQITVYVVDTGSAPVSGCVVDIFDPTNTHFISRLRTDILGKAVLAIDPGTYAIRLWASGYAFTVPEMLTVTVDATVTYTGTSLIIITPPSSPNLCAIYGTVRDAAGNPVANAEVAAYAVTPQVVNDTQESAVIAATVTDANGYFRLELERLAQVSFTIQDTGLDVIRTVPDLPSQDIATWT